MRGYGGSSAPAEIDAYAITSLVGDTVGLVAALGETRAAIVGTTGARASPGRRR
jgi:pimeloyl-ACP methyl ester carboxylesterase